MPRPCNDDVTQVLPWLYIGGVKNTRKTLPLIDVWYDFKHDVREPRNLQVDSRILVRHLPFDDGDIDTAIPLFQLCLEEIQAHKKAGRKVFVSCYEGVSRSAVMVLWLCCEELRQFDKAWQHLKSCRNIYPDKAFLPFIETLKANYP